MLFRSDVFPLPEPILTLPGRNSNAAYQVHFIAKDLAPLGFAAYHVTVGGKRNVKKYSTAHKVKRVTLSRLGPVEGRQDIVFENDVSSFGSSVMNMLCQLLTRIERRYTTLHTFAYLVVHIVGISTGFG